MKNLAQLRQYIVAISVLILFGGFTVSTVFGATAVKKVVLKKPVQTIPWATIDALVRKSEMNENRTTIVDDYYFFSDKLESRLNQLGLSLDDFQVLIEEGLNRPPEAPQGVTIMGRYRIDADTVGVWYRAKYMSGYEGSRDDMIFLTKTDEDWKIDPEYSWWFFNKSCYVPPTWAARKANATCNNSAKSFRGKAGSNGEIGKRVGELVKRIQQGREMMRAYEQKGAAKEAEVPEGG